MRHEALMTREQFEALEEWIKAEAMVLITARSCGPQVAEYRKERDDARHEAWAVFRLPHEGEV